jgi:hypothetical protein
MAKEGGFPLNEFTFAKAAKKSTIGNYSTLHVGKSIRNNYNKI